MNYFTFKEPRVENGRKVLELNILPEKRCPFDCVYCPVSRAIARVKTTEIARFGPVADSLAELERRVRAARPDLVFINSTGEALYSDRLPEVIAFLHGLGLPVRLLSNGYPLGELRFARTAALCEEVIGELKSGREGVFQSVQRPVPGCTLERYLRGMADFRSHFSGTFILEITVVRKYSDDAESLQFFCRATREIRPDALNVVTIEDEPFARALAVDQKTLARATKTLHDELDRSRT